MGLSKANVKSIITVITKKVKEIPELLDRVRVKYHMPPIAAERKASRDGNQPQSNGMSPSRTAEMATSTSTEDQSSQSGTQTESTGTGTKSTTTSSGGGCSVGAAIFTMFGAVSALSCFGVWLWKRNVNDRPKSWWERVQDWFRA